MAASPTALVAVRPTHRAKLRLAHLAGPEARTTLILRLFEHVMEVLVASGLRVVALSPEPVDVPEGVERWDEAGAGLNRALAGALDELSGPVLVLPADLPQFATSAVSRLLDEPGDVVVVRARDGGTNALLLRDRIEPAFGPRSALAHAAAARARGLRARVVAIPELSEDLDDEPALVRALDRTPGLPPGTGRLLGLRT